MCESYGRSLLRVSVAQICQALGWDAVQLTACDLLADVLQRYIQQMGRVCHRYSELYGRTDPVLDDVSQAFRLLGVSLSELDDYVNNLEPVAFPQQLPTFPVGKNNVLQFPQPGALLAEERKEEIPDYMPPLVSLQEEEEEEEEEGLPAMGTSAEAMQVAVEEDEEDFDEDETAQSKTDGVHKLPLSVLSERMGKENIHVRHNVDGKEPDGGPFLKAAPDNGAIEDSISTVIAKACLERRPDPFAFSSGSDSDSNDFSGPRRLTIMEPAAARAPPGAGPLQLGPGKWTLDDSIDEVIRKVHQGGPSPRPPNRQRYVSSGSASPPTPEPLLKVFQEKAKLSALDVKKKLKSKLRKKEKPRDKEREKDKSKLKEKNKDKSKSKDLSKDGKVLWKDFGLKEDQLLAQRDFAPPEGAVVKLKTRDGEGAGGGGGGPKKDKDKHKDKKKDREKGKKEKEKKDKGKDRSRDERHKQGPLAPVVALGELPALFGPSSCQRLPPVTPALMPALQDAKSKEKDKKKDKKEKKKKKERERAKEKEEKRKEKERDKDKREKEKDKERLRLEKVFFFFIMPVRSVVTETVSTYVIRDESGNQIWICPGCDKPDDGSPMIGCDDCDDWYHWVCVGIVAAPPADQQWFCVKCSSKKKDKKHKKKKHKPH
uniref:Transcription initiation factor TFIID subunit 3 n=1 Tax=Hippocampus comes TaxID=109280 RepID=A0A3Q2YXY8_HIPCM